MHANGQERTTIPLFQPNWEIVDSLIFKYFKSSFVYFGGGPLGMPGELFPDSRVRKRGVSMSSHKERSLPE